MKINIPCLGQQIRLSQDWSFSLHPEERNASLFRIMKLTAPRVSNTYMNNGYGTFVEEIFSPTHRTMNTPGSKNSIPVVQVHPLAKADNRMDIFKGSLVSTDSYTLKYDRHEIYEYEQFYIHMTLPQNTLLVVDRIFIRKGAEDFDSMTFKILECDLAPMFGHKTNVIATKQPRFWVKLSDANNIEY